jgi:RNA polymerase sigma factor for flagellar operon FliA
MREKELWEKKKAGSKLAREKLVELYLPLVRAIARKIKKSLPGSCPDIEELESSGMVGLVYAIDNFDPDRGLKFITYALPRIRGAILDELRKLDFLPRSARERANIIQKEQEELTQKLSRVPSQTEIASRTSIPVETIYIYSKERNTHISLDAPLPGEDEGTSVSDTLSSEENQKDPLRILTKNEIQMNLLKALDSLPPRDKIVLALHYIEGFHFKEISRMLGLTESRVSQIHSRGLAELKNIIEKVV